MPGAGVPCSNYKVSTSLTTNHTLEPISTAAPKVSSKAKFDIIDYRQGSHLALICPAQGYPLPNFRLVYLCCLIDTI